MKKQKQRKITLEELQRELKAWKTCCTMSEVDTSWSERIIRNLNDWADMVAE